MCAMSNRKRLRRLISRAREFRAHVKSACSFERRFAAHKVSAALLHVLRVDSCAALSLGAATIHRCTANTLFAQANHYLSQSVSCLDFA